jgi:hypothetical protein
MLDRRDNASHQVLVTTEVKLSICVMPRALESLGVAVDSASHTRSRCREKKAPTFTVAYGHAIVVDDVSADAGNGISAALRILDSTTTAKESRNDAIYSDEPKFLIV